MSDASGADRAGRRAAVTEDEMSLPDSTAVRVALWRAIHVHLDARLMRSKTR